MKLPTVETRKTARTMTKQTFNFCAGPAALPRSVMEKAQQEFLDWQSLGASVMEVSHRSSQYAEMAETAERNLRQLLGVNDDYAVLFMQGGASMQFSAIAMTLLNSAQPGEYLSNGVWSNKAVKEARRFGEVHEINVIETREGKHCISDESAWGRAVNAAYTHYTPNETIDGLRFPEKISSTAPVIADMSSCILSEDIDVADFDLIYAGAQKNIGPAGMTIVIVKRSLFERMSFERLPAILNYQEQDKHGSMINTPPTYTWYLAGLVFEWVMEQGGVAQMEKLAIERASALYDYIDQDTFYSNPNATACRSRMNIPFILSDDRLNKAFLEGAESANMIGLKGHRSVGGMRASLYNSMTMEGVAALVDYMAEFKRKFG